MWIFTLPPEGVFSTCESSITMNWSQKKILNSPFLSLFISLVRRLNEIWIIGIPGWHAVFMFKKFHAQKAIRQGHLPTSLSWEKKGRELASLEHDPWARPFIQSNSSMYFVPDSMISKTRSTVTNGTASPLIERTPFVFYHPCCYCPSKSPV
jgi:hypothetical protein